MIPSVTSQATQVALLEWANSMLAKLLPGQNRDIKIKKPDDLFDGAVFSALLEILDDEYNPSRFQQSLAATPTDSDMTQGRKRYLHIIHLGLKDIARRHAPKIEPLIDLVDFQALAWEPTKIDMFEILVLFVCAACLREDDNSRYITLVTQLDERVQQGIFRIISESRTKLDQLEEAADDGIDANFDDLAQEAALVNQHQKLQEDVQEATRQASLLKVRLDRLQDNYDELLEKHSKLQEENEHLHRQIDSEVSNFNKHHIQRQLKENESIIANLENERNFLVEERDRLLKERARLEQVAHKAEALADENQELRSKNEDLSKKANMADNLRKKLESMKSVETELKTLHNERVDAAKLLEQLEISTLRIEVYKKEAEKYAEQFQKYEEEVASFGDQKIMYTSEINELRGRIEGLQARSQTDEAIVKDLQEKVMMLDPTAAPSTPSGHPPTSLEDELNESGNSVSMRNIEIQRLQAENAVLRSSIGTETEKGQLIHEMEDLRTARQALQDKYNDIFEKYTVSQHQLDALIQNMGKDGDEAYSNLRTQVLAEQNRCRQLERQLESTNQKLADKERALLELQGDFNAVEKSSQEALAELKRTDGMLAISLRAELEAERNKHKLLREEFENQRSQLLTAFIEKDQLRREAEVANREMQRAADGLSVNTDSAKQSEKMEKLRARYKQLQQQYEQSDVKNRELERTLKAVRAGSEAGVQKARTDQIIKNLQRENAMISTAWYDLTNRLQSTHVVLQRRQEVPRSWLNKQRQMVNATPRK
ncbi:hypothetical protein F4813DRAFT_360128 [Daldinia decipiens]|uniref:uncharacterized protein n=1 Tax=Daldinia decipiens TaxID=326647 RepID=UPI0020C1BEF8|nr:uncharacterized protein F4813DRAFT_360128 [Daldinia decipiens]KAI1657471.1 hypothetical protein F4813DRAFT_360128 [Daldinia decipiens]